MEHVREQEIKSYINSIVTSDYDLYELLNLNEEEKELLFIFISRLKGSRDTDAYFENINSVTLNKLGQIIGKIYIEVAKISQLGIYINIITLNLIGEQYKLIVDSKVAQQDDPFSYYPLDHLFSESDSDTLENDFDSPVPAPISATYTPNSKTPMGPQGTPYIQSPGAAASAAAVPLSSARELFTESKKKNGGKKRKRRRTKKRKSKKKRKRKSKRKSRKRRKRTRRS